MKAAKSSKLRLPQRSDAVAGNEARQSKPSAVAQKKNPTLQPARPKKLKPGR